MLGNYGGVYFLTDEVESGMFCRVGPIKDLKRNWRYKSSSQRTTEAQDLLIK